MTIRELFAEMNSWGGGYETARPGAATCDTCKAGDMDREVTKVALSMFATPDVVRKCAETGAQLLIVHEPTFYNHWDDRLPNALAEEKKAFIENSGVTVVRFHDHAHGMSPDVIYAGEVKYMGLRGQRVPSGQFAVNDFMLDEEITARDLARQIEKNTGIRRVRIAGCADKPGRRVCCAFGTPGGIDKALERNDFVLTGELCEWAEGQLARDYDQLGYNKAILVLGHIGSERDGFRLLTDIIKSRIPGIEAEYIECGEVYTYTD